MRTCTGGEAGLSAAGSPGAGSVAVGDDLIGAVVMPDHAHALLRPKDGVELSRITKGIKGVSARIVNEARGQRGPLWQDESWDRIVRDQEELDEKLQYMLDNPVRAGLASDGWEYDAWYVNQRAV